MLQFIYLHEKHCASEVLVSQVRRRRHECVEDECRVEDVRIGYVVQGSLDRYITSRVGFLSMGNFSIYPGANL